MNRIKLYIKDTNKAKDVAKNIEEAISKSDYIIDNQDYHYAMSIGGDGTFLKMIHDNDFNENIYYLGINAGSLGFLTEFTIDDISSLFNRSFNTKEIYLLKTTITTDNEILDFYSINEIVIKNASRPLLKTNIYINKDLLNNYVGDGIMISTSTGSTAYNLSYNGSIIDNELNIMSLVPIAPIKNKIYKSITNNIIINGKKEIELNFKTKENISLISDGKIININKVKKLSTMISNKKIKVIINDNDSYIKKINEKIIDI